MRAASGQRFFSGTPPEAGPFQNDERSYPKGVIAMMMELMNVEPLFWIGMGAVAAVICLMQAVCWTRTPKMRRNE